MLRDLVASELILAMLLMYAGIAMADRKRLVLLDAIVARGLFTLGQFVFVVAMLTVVTWWLWGAFVSRG